jgi:predicted N-formylglutamate amidohydrolase
MSPSPRSPAPAPLLRPDEPPPFEVLNPDGRAPILLVCDHASNRIPRALGTLGLDEVALGLHVASDIGAEIMTRTMSACLDAPAVLANYSRLVIDLNRPPEHPTSIVETSDDIAVPGNRALDRDAREARLAALFRPYHQAVAERIATVQRRGVPPMVLAVHSFTPRLGGEDRRWQAGILWNRDGRLARALIDGLSTPGDIVVGDNEPYSGRTLFYTLDIHAGAAGLAHAGIEVRQDLVMEPESAHAWGERLADVVEKLIGRVDLHRIEHFG